MIALLVATDKTLGLTPTGWTVVAVVVAAVAVLATAWQALIAVLNERKRTQPIVLAHSSGPRELGGHPGESMLPTYLTNEGGGNAFNVRFGVELRGVRYAWKFASEDSDHGSVYRVGRVGDRLPVEASFPVSVPRGSTVSDDLISSLKTSNLRRLPVAKRV